MKPDRRLVLAGATSLMATSPFAREAWGSGLLNASDVLAQERTHAAAEGKRVLLAFHASWCAWCRPMEALLNDAAMQRVVSRRYRVLRVRALERRPEQRALQMAGADELMLNYTHPSAGLPFLAFLDESGHAAVSSFSSANGENIGFPVGNADLDAFDAMLRRALPEMTARECAAVRAACVRLAGR